MEMHHQGAGLQSRLGVRDARAGMIVCGFALSL